MAPSPQLTVQCKIVGHASPRWKSASTNPSALETMKHCHGIGQMLS
jgi:hypothetical protein